MDITPQRFAGAKFSQLAEGHFGRHVILFATMGVCASNGLAAIILKSIRSEGAASAAWSTFDVSVLIWISLFLGLKYASAATEYVRASPLDLVICSLCLMLSLIPVGHPSWLALTLVCIRASIVSSPNSSLGKGTRILLAVTVPVFWARLIFSFYAPTLLGIDARITGLILGTPVKGNLVQFADHSAYFQIYPACSSFGNISLALLGLWTVLNIGTRRSTGLALLMACGLSFSVFSVNIARLAAIGMFPEHFDLIHGSTGSSVAGGLAMLLVAVFCTAYWRRLQH